MARLATSARRTLGLPVGLVLAIALASGAQAIASPGATARAPADRGTAQRAPVIRSLTISHLSATNATLTARIDGEGLATSYEYSMLWSPCSHKGSGCEVVINVPLPGGTLAPKGGTQTVKLDLNKVGVTLHGGEYAVALTASNSAGSAQPRSLVFEPPEA